MSDNKEYLQPAMSYINEDESKEEQRVPVQFYDEEVPEEDIISCVVCNENIEGNPTPIFSHDDYDVSYICDSCLIDSNKYYECEKENCDIVFDIADTDYTKADVKYGDSMLLCPDCQYIEDEGYGQGNDDYASYFED